MLKPLNRYVVVEPVKEQKRDSGVLVPEEYQKALDQKHHMVVEVISVNECDPVPLKKGLKLVVPTHAVEKIEALGENYHVVLENHVIGFFDN